MFEAIVPLVVKGKSLDIRAFLLFSSLRLSRFLRLDVVSHLVAHYEYLTKYV